MNLLRKRKSRIFMIVVLCTMLVAFGFVANASAAGLPGRALSMEQMSKIVGKIDCSECKPNGQVCGWGRSCAVGGHFLTDCCNIVPCVPNPTCISWKCSKTFTNRKSCFYKPNSTCDPSGGGSIDCGSGAICLAFEATCIECDCYVTGVSLCGGIPYLTDCGQYSTCG